MGYSISAPIKSKKALGEMWEFLQQNYRSWNKVLETSGNPKAIKEAFLNKGYDPSEYLCLAEDLDYDNGKLRIGFNYSSQWISGPYMNSLLSWVCLQVGRKRHFKACSEYRGVAEALPYYVYDGDMAIPLVIGESWDRGKPFSTIDPMGILWEGPFETMVEHYPMLLRKEIHRLDNLWEG